MPKEVLSLLWTLLVVVAVLALAYWFTRVVIGRSAGNGAIRFRGRRVTVLEQVAVGKDQKLLLVQVGEEIYFLGSTPGGISCLEQIPLEEAERWKQEDQAGQSAHQGLSFQEALKNVLERRKDRGGS